MRKTYCFLALVISGQTACDIPKLKKTEYVAPFQETKIYQDGIFNYNGDSDAGKHFAYLYSADVQNTTDFLFDRVTIRYRAEIELDNGNVIKDDLISGIFITYFESYTQWKSKESKKVTKIYYLIPVKYADYPVVNVSMILDYECFDEINHTSKTYTVYKDVTDLWRIAVARYRKNEWDMDSPFGWDKIALKESSVANTSNQSPQGQVSPDEEEQAARHDSGAMLLYETDSTSF